MPLAPREGGSGDGRSSIDLQPTAVRVLVGVDSAGVKTYAIECDSPVAKYRFVLPSIAFLEFAVKVMEALVQSLKAEKRGR